MNKSLELSLAFIGGAAAGAVAGALYFRQLFEKRYQEDVKSVKEVYCCKKEKVSVKEPEKQKTENLSKSVKKPSVTTPVTDYTSYSSKIQKLGYAPEEKKNDIPAKKVDYHTIPPEEFSMEDDYDCQSLICYEDGIVTNGDGSEIKKSELNEMVGSDFSKHFGEYEDDSVFIRNDRLQMDFEIIRDRRTYAEATGQSILTGGEDECGKTVF